ncbi:MAG: hypothetical protein Q4D94_03745 [Bacillota bacterium]|nr:hypothetical protein [Bacillota bacterium]
MGIEFLSGFGSVQSYYKAPQIPAVDSEEISKQQQMADEAKQQEQPVTYSSKEQPQVLDNRLRAADLENISLSFNKEEDYGYIGSESSLAELDVQKAISDMRKDSVLQEYQYFVGSAQTLFNGNEDGIVIPKFTGIE